MTSRWFRAHSLTLCRSCLRWVNRNEPMQVQTFGDKRTRGWEIRRRLCTRCASEPVPADVPELPQRVEISSFVKPTPPRSPARVLSFASVGAMAVDWKARQAGREPGEDDE